MAAFSQLPSGKWRAQVRRGGVSKNATFPSKREAKAWAVQIEAQIQQVAVGGFAAPPKDATVSDLIDKYVQARTKPHGRTKAATLEMLKREIGKVKLAALNALVLRDFIDRRVDAGAGGVTIAGDLSFLSAVLHWGRHSRHLDLPDRIALDARASLKHRGLKTRSNERRREPTNGELSQLYEYWASKPRQRIEMVELCKMALATGMRLGEICGLQVEDVNVQERTVLIRDRKDPREKVGNNEVVPLLQEAWELVEPRMRMRPSGALYPFHPASASTAFTRATEALGIQDLHFHDLRHRATTEFFRKGLDIPRVALMTGHKTWSMLRRYTAITPSDVHEAVAQHTRRHGHGDGAGSGPAD